ANAIHLSCWRSSPRARRSRTTREAAAARPSTNISSTPATWRLYPILKLAGAEAGALSLRFTSNVPHNAHPVTAIVTTTRNSATPDSQATGRHRREGRWPSGNNRIRNVKSTRMPGLHVNVPSHDMKPPNGNIPGRSTKALVAHSVLRAARPNDRPIPQNSHPIGLLGRWAAISAPSTEKDVTTTIPNSPKPASELWSALAIQTAAPSIAMEATALLHAATEAVRCCIYTPPAWVRRHLARSRHPGEGALTSEMEGSTRPRRADCLRRGARRRLEPKTPSQGAGAPRPGAIHPGVWCGQPCLHPVRHGESEVRGDAGLKERTRKQLVRAGWVITIALALTNVVLIVLARRELATSGGDIIFASVGTVAAVLYASTG